MGSRSRESMQGENNVHRWMRGIQDKSRKHGRKLLLLLFPHMSPICRTRGHRRRLVFPIPSLLFRTRHYQTNKRRENREKKALMWKGDSLTDTRGNISILCLEVPTALFLFMNHLEVLKEYRNLFRRLAVGVLPFCSCLFHVCWMLKSTVSAEILLRVIPLFRRIAAIFGSHRFDGFGIWTRDLLFS